MLDAPAYADPLTSSPWDTPTEDGWDPAWIEDWGGPAEVDPDDVETWEDVLRPMSDFQLSVLAAVMRQESSIGVRGGWGCAKTATQALMLWYVATTRPGARCMWVTDTSTRRETVVQVEAEKFWLGARYEASKKRWVFPNGSIIWLREYFRAGTKASHQNPLEGPTMHFIAVDESQVFSTKEVADKAAGRLRQALEVNGVRYGTTMALMGLPVQPAWWIDWVEKDGGVTFYPVTSDNIYNDEAYVESLRRRLDPEEFQAMVMNVPTSPKGTVLRNWKAETWPHGNLVDDWTPRPDIGVSIGVDFGRKPAIVFIQHAPDIGPNGLDIIFDEICLNDVDMDEWVPLILKTCWPQSHPHGRPEGRLTLMAGAGDKAGANRDSHGRSDITDLARKPSQGGIGLHLHRTTDPVKVDVETGLKKLNRLIFDGRTDVASEQRRLVMTRELWDRGNAAPVKAMTLARAIQAYKWRDDRPGVPLKDGRNDHLIDALRYWCIRFRWFDSPLDEKTIKRAVTQPDARSKGQRKAPRQGRGRPRGR